MNYLTYKICLKNLWNCLWESWRRYHQRECHVTSFPRVLWISTQLILRYRINEFMWHYTSLTIMRIYINMVHSRYRPNAYHVLKSLMNLKPKVNASERASEWVGGWVSGWGKQGGGERAATLPWIAVNNLNMAHNSDQNKVWNDTA